MIKHILEELRHHAPFTIFGAFFGIIFMIFFSKTPSEISYNLFYILHPFHVVLSALVTASIYEFHTCKRGEGRCNLWILLIIGYVGSVGIATLSDSIIPYIGETLLRMPHRHAHIGFIEKWYIVNPLAILGIMVAYFRPSTKFPHAGHVFVSTWASLLHIIMAAGKPLAWPSYIAVFLFLFLAVWLPCCISDIVFPLLFVEKGASRHYDKKEAAAQIS